MYKKTINLGLCLIAMTLLACDSNVTERSVVKETTPDLADAEKPKPYHSIVQANEGFAVAGTDTYIDQCKSAGISIPPLLPDPMNNNGWTQVGGTYTKDVDVFTTGAPSSKLYTYEDASSICFLVDRRQYPKTTTTVIGEYVVAQCYKKATCEVCALTSDDKTINFNTSVDLMVAPKNNDDCSGCHLAGPILLGENIIAKAFPAMRSLSATCLAKGGPTWIFPPSVQHTWRKPCKDKACECPIDSESAPGCSGCHTKFFKTVETNDTPRLCQVLNLAFSSPNSLMHEHIKNDPESCAAVAACMGCNFCFVQKVKVKVSGSGEGTVSSYPDGISCSKGSDEGCEATFSAPDTLVNLRARADAKSKFVGWAGDCAETNSQLAKNCTLKMDGINNSFEAAAIFVKGNQQEHKLSVTVNKGGSISASSGKIKSCSITAPNKCSDNYVEGLGVILRANPDRKFVFVGWSGTSCSGQSTCNVTMDKDQTVTANFAPADHNLKVGVSGEGSGYVTSDKEGINCGAIATGTVKCNLEPVLASEITLNAVAAFGSRFWEWKFDDGGGCIAGLTSTQRHLENCKLSVDRPMTVTAVFIPDPVTERQVNLTLIGDGQGKVSRVINCEKTTSSTVNCEGAILPVGSVELTAEPNDGSAFAGWTVNGQKEESCGDAMACKFNLPAPLAPQSPYELVAKFSTLPPPPKTLAVAILGGPGVLTSDPAGIDCPGKCSASFPSGTNVVLTAKASTIDTDMGTKSTKSVTWTDCAGTANGPMLVPATCIPNLASGKTVKATFSTEYKVKVEKVNSDPSKASIGSVSISVQSVPKAICDGTCSQPIEAFVTKDDTVTVTAIPPPNTAVVWSNQPSAITCSGNICTGPVNAAMKIQVEFKAFPELKITKSGEVTIVSNAIDINCSSTSGNCSAKVAKDTKFTLTFSKAIGKKLVLGGLCQSTVIPDNAPTGTCTIDKMPAVDIEISAVITAAPVTYTLTVVPQSGSTITGSGINCAAPAVSGNVCLVALEAGTNVSLSAVTPYTSLVSWFRPLFNPVTGSTYQMTMPAQNTSITTSVVKLYNFTASVVGSGTVTAAATSGSQGSNACGQGCIQVSAGAQIHVTALPTTAGDLVNFSAGCAKSSPTECNITMPSANASVVATITGQPTAPFRLNLNNGNGFTTGPVTVSYIPASGSPVTATSCESTCQIPVGSIVTVTAADSATAFFMDSQIVGGTTLKDRTRNVSIPSSGITLNVNYGYKVKLIRENGAVGTITGLPSPIDLTCTTECSYLIKNGTPLALYANDSSGWEFSKWTWNGTTSTSRSYSVNGTGTLTLTYTKLLMLTVVPQGGSGYETFQFSPVLAGQPCQTKSCYARPNSTVTVTADVNNETKFKNWSQGSGSVSMGTSDKSISAVFEYKNYEVSKTVNGSGTLQISSATTPQGVATYGGACPTPPLNPNCVKTFHYADRVQFTAVPASGYQLLSMTGAGVSSSGLVTVPVNGTTITANFVQIATPTPTATPTATPTPTPTATPTITPTPTPATKLNVQVTVVKPASSAGTVIFPTGGVSCSGPATGTCQAYSNGTTVNLNVTPGYNVVWSGSCSGTNVPCSIPSLSAAAFVTATISRTFTLTLNVHNNVSDPSFFVGWLGGMLNNGSQTINVNEGEAVSLTARWGEEPSNLVSWGPGGCDSSTTPPGPTDNVPTRMTTCLINNMTQNRSVRISVDR